MEHSNSIQLFGELNEQYNLQLPATDNLTLLQAALANRINQLIVHDFNQLVTLLYRIDIAEKKLQKTLQEHREEDAGMLIAGIVIERQLQKIQSRQQYRRNDITDDAEQW